MGKSTLLKAMGWGLVRGWQRAAALLLEACPVTQASATAACKLLRATARSPLLLRADRASHAAPAR